MTAKCFWTTARISATAIVLAFVATFLMTGMFSTKASPESRIGNVTMTLTPSPGCNPVSFTNAGTLTVGNSPTRAVIGDFNEDGNVGGMHAGQSCHRRFQSRRQG